MYLRARLRLGSKQCNKEKSQCIHIFVGVEILSIRDEGNDSGGELLVSGGAYVAESQRKQ